MTIINQVATYLSTEKYQKEYKAQYEDRVVRMHDEFMEVFRRYSGLGAFINNTEAFAKVDEGHRNLMPKQYKAMGDYLKALGARIILDAKNFPNVTED
ncbi:hypothetical protein MA9V2_136 [Chryseobacterium phage MA9V-2]|nr:hypothetical protein MA9V2_136 [Chryseobacterium phage MA9V-2]